MSDNFTELARAIAERIAMCEAALAVCPRLDGTAITIAGSPIQRDAGGGLPRDALGRVKSGAAPFVIDWHGMRICVVLDDGERVPLSQASMALRVRALPELPALVASVRGALDALTAQGEAALIEFDQAATIHD